MQTELVRLEGNRVELRVEMSAEEVGKAFGRAYQQMATRLKIPGFRPGKAPRPLIDRYVGREAVAEAAFDALFPPAYFSAVQETGIEPVDQPEVTEHTITEGQPCTFKVRVDVMPEVHLGQYRGLPAVKAVTPVTETDVNEVLHRIQENQAELVASDEAKLDRGLFAVIDFEGFVDGQPFSGGAGKDVTLEVGGGRFLPEFEAGLVGAAKGEEREVKVTFPANYHAAHLAGKEALFKLSVKEVKTKKLPELDDEFAKDTSDFATFEELKEDVRRKIAEERDKAAREALENQLVAQATANAQVEVPEKLIARRVETKLQEMVERLHQAGFTLAEYLGEERTEADLRRELAAVAGEELKSRLVVDAIVKAEGIRISEAEILERLKGLAGGDEQKARELKGRLEKDDRLDDLVGRLAAERAVNLLLETAEIKEEVTPAEPEKDKGQKPKAATKPRAKSAKAAPEGSVEPAEGDAPKPKTRRKSEAKEDKA